MPLYNVVENNYITIDNFETRIFQVALKNCIIYLLNCRPSIISLVIKFFRAKCTSFLWSSKIILTCLFSKSRYAACLSGLYPNCRDVLIENNMFSKRCVLKISSAPSFFTFFRQMTHIMNIIYNKFFSKYTCRMFNKGS